MDLKGKKTEELKKMISDKRDALGAFRFGSSGAKTKDVKEAMHLKKDIARILTEMNKKK